MNEIGKIYHRPWGCYQTLMLADGYQVKMMTINPGGALSLQKHQHRTEHWIVVKGTPIITVDKKASTYDIGARALINKNTLHRAENHTTDPVVIIEVQLGDYLGEDDITRLHDIYKRNNDPNS